MKFNFNDLINCPMCKSDLEQFVKQNNIDSDELQNLLGMYTLFCERKRDNRTKYPDNSWFITNTPTVQY